MRKIASLALMPLFAGFLLAQSNNQATQSESQSTTTTTKTTTYMGTLVDAGCRTKVTENKETTTDANGAKTRTVTTNEVKDCPVTPTTTAFGIQTPEGKFIRFDDPSNTKVIEIVKTNQTWNKSIIERAPVKVRVIGAPNGDTLVVESIE